MKSTQKTPFTYGSIPHSVLKRIQEIKNPTASSLLLYLARRTHAFRKPSIILTYRELAEAINCCWRSVATAAQRLEEWGDLIRTPQADGRYCWTLTLDRSEVISDPDQAFAVRQDPVLGTPPCKIDHGGHARSIMGGMQDRSWGPADGDQSSKPVPATVPDSPKPPQKEPLKKSLKEINLKKHHGPGPATSELDEAPEPQRAVCKAKTDDESSHKFLIKSMIEVGIRQRKARQLCRENDHDLIRRVLKTAPQRPGIKNLAAYIVTEIKDGGYEPLEQAKSPGESSHPGNYAHLTTNKLPEGRHRNVKPVSDSPRALPGPDQTKAEQARLDREKQRQSQTYSQSLRELLGRYKGLSDDLKLGLQESARSYLHSMLPPSRREEMAADQTFKNVAIKSTLERFFELVDDGLTGLQALRSPLMPGCG